MTPEDKANEFYMRDVMSGLPQNEDVHSYKVRVKLTHMLAQAIREAKIEAYEEAAKEAERHTANEYPDEGLPREIATSIRALRDSLVEAVPS